MVCHAEHHIPSLQPLNLGSQNGSRTKLRGWRCDRFHRAERVAAHGIPWKGEKVNIQTCEKVTINNLPNIWKLNANIWVWPPDHPLSFYNILYIYSLFMHSWFTNLPPSSPCISSTQLCARTASQHLSRSQSQKINKSIPAIFMVIYACKLYISFGSLLCTVPSYVVNRSW